MEAAETNGLFTYLSFVGSMASHSQQPSVYQPIFNLCMSHSVLVSLHCTWQRKKFLRRMRGVWRREGIIWRSASASSEGRRKPAAGSGRAGSGLTASRAGAGREESSLVAEPAPDMPASSSLLCRRCLFLHCQVLEHGRPPLPLPTHEVLLLLLRPLGGDQVGGVLHSLLWTFTYGTFIQPSTLAVYAGAILHFVALPALSLPVF